MSEQYIYCPQCGSDNIENPGDTGEDGGDLLECMDCQIWQGGASELVSKDAEDVGQCDL